MNVNEDIQKMIRTMNQESLNRNIELAKEKHYLMDLERKEMTEEIVKHVKAENDKDIRQIKYAIKENIKVEEDELKEVFKVLKEDLETELRNEELTIRTDVEAKMEEIKEHIKTCMKGELDKKKKMEIEDTLKRQRMLLVSVSSVSFVLGMGVGMGMATKLL